jgi:hypothetical protein
MPDGEPVCGGRSDRHNRAGAPEPGVTAVAG